ncbi:MAG: sulfite exporter TauE/SafE family protein [Gemmatimonadota bacterium]|nr:sulfite exporter TauE/SafE family protein [Gemmatimonadota bacterium]
MTPLQVVAATLTVTLGATLQGSIGFGLGLFSVPILLLIEPDFIPAPLLLASVALTLLLTHRERHTIIWGDLKWALGGRIAGIALAALLLVVVPADRFAIPAGVLVLGAVGLSASGLHLPPRPRTLVGAGVLSGLLGTAVSIGGPPMALIYQRESGPRLRGTLSAFFVIGVALSLIGLRVAGRFDLGDVLLAATLVPGILVGFAISRYTAHRLDRGFTRPAVLIVSAVASLLVILRHVL